MVVPASKFGVKRALAEEIRRADKLRNRQEELWVRYIKQLYKVHSIKDPFTKSAFGRSKTSFNNWRKSYNVWEESENNIIFLLDCLAKK